MARSRAERTGNAREALATGVDAWVATASPAGRPHLVPLSFALFEGLVLVATLEASATARNAVATGRVRLGVGEVRDVVMVEATAQVAPWATANPRHTSAFVEARGWDPGDEPFEFVLLELRPTRVQAWRDVDEIAGRELMADGAWFEA